MEKNALIAIVLSILILILYQEWVRRAYPPAPPAPEQQGEQRAREAPTPPSSSTAKAAKVATPRASDRPSRDIRVETDRYVAVFTTRGARLKSFILKHYRSDIDPKSPPIEMVSVAPGLPLPLGVTVQGPKTLDDEGLVYSVEESDVRLTGDEKGSLTFRAQMPGGMSIVKRLTFSGSSYPIEIQLDLDGAEREVPVGMMLSSLGENKGLKQDAIFEGAVLLVDSRIKREPLAEILKGLQWKGSISWAGFGYTYFLFALVPEDDGTHTADTRPAGAGVVLELQPSSGLGPEKTGRYTLFAGPKDLDVLKAAGHALERSIDFGYFAFVSLPLLYVLRFFHRFTGNYGIDIILLTVLIKLLLAPLTHKSFVSMKQMQKLQPQMERIKEKYKNDREALNKEIMELYRRNKVNPFGGCLPMLLQIPVFIGLYNALLTPIELRHTSFLWIQDLSRPDWESLPIQLAGWSFGIPVLTVLMGASMFVQQWMTPSAGDPNQRRMMLMMPLIFTVMFVTFPAGLTIYWLVNNVLSIGQQYLINRWSR